MRPQLRDAELHCGVGTSPTRRVTTLRFDQAKELARVVGEAWEDCG